MTSAPIRLALPLIGRGLWTGGFVYLKNTLQLIRSRLARDIELSVFLSPAEQEKFGTELAPLVDGRLIVDPAIVQSGRGGSLARALVLGRDRDLERLLVAAGADVTFEVASFCGARFGLPVIAWLPDFQHRYMPEMFTRANWWRRELGFRAQIGSSRTLMVSSETAHRDIERFYPASRGRTHVVRFAIDLDITQYMGRSAEMRAVYQLPGRFFFLPNQFWCHKNHSVIVAALARIKAEGVLKGVPPVILSGLAKDPHNIDYFDKLISEARAAGVDNHFRYLGLVPRDHVLSLAASCDTLINPSHFEGWSTPVEEAKAFGAPLMLSDIPIHREQAPHARFFDRRSDVAAAEAMIEIARRPPAPRAPTLNLVADQNRRLNDHAASLLRTIKAAVGVGRAV
jgi:glycosyltransferase involved in cell wall biosynthesis